MSTTPSSELHAFHQFISQQLTSDGADLAPEEALVQFRSKHPLAKASPQSVAAIQEAIDDMERGDAGRPAAEVIREVREKYGLSNMA